MIAEAFVKKIFFRLGNPFFDDVLAAAAEAITAPPGRRRIPVPAVCHGRAKSD